MILGRHGPVGLGREDVQRERRVRVVLEEELKGIVPLIRYRRHHGTNRGTVFVEQRAGLVP